MQNISPENKQIVRVAVSEAARLFGVNAQTIRRALKNQELTYIVVAGRYKINLESLIKWSQKKTTVRNKSNKQGIGQYVEKWKISNTLYSPSTRSLGVPSEASLPETTPLPPRGGNLAWGEGDI